MQTLWTYKEKLRKGKCMEADSLMQNNYVYSNATDLQREKE